MPLVWISDCFGALNYVELPKKYLMLTMIEDAIREKGKVSPEPTGSYFRLVWLKGMSDSRFKEYARQSYKYLTIRTTSWTRNSHNIVDSLIAWNSHHIVDSPRGSHENVMI
jgi:hypothetical protein